MRLNPSVQFGQQPLLELGLEPDLLSGPFGLVNRSWRGLRHILQLVGYGGIAGSDGDLGQ